jgi:hypothetical protein
MARRLAKTIQRLDVITLILREENGLRAGDITARMTPDLLGLGEPGLAWSKERLAYLGHLIYPHLIMLEKDGTVFGLRNGTTAALWFLVNTDTVHLDPKLVAQIESMSEPY